MDCDGVTTASTECKDRCTKSRYRCQAGGVSWPRTARHHELTQECAVSTTGVRQGKAPWPYEFRCTISGEEALSNASSHLPDSSTSRHGFSIHSSLKGLLKSRSRGISLVSEICASEGAPPKASNN